MNKPFFLKQLNKLRRRNKGVRAFITVPVREAGKAVAVVRKLTGSMLLFELKPGDSLSLKLAVVIRAEYGCLADKIGRLQPGYMEQRTVEPEEECLGILLEWNPEGEEAVVHDELFDQVPDTYTVSDLYVYDGYVYPVFARNRGRRPFRSGTRPIAILTDQYFGNGDAAMIYDQLQAFIDRQLMHNREVHVICKQATFQFFQGMLRGCKVWRASDATNMHKAILQSPWYEQVYLVPFLTSRPPLLHYAEHCAAAFGFREPVNLTGRGEFKLPPMSDQGKDLLAQCCSSGRPVIGLQFHTKDAKRCWSSEQASRFCRLCQAAGITVVQLTPSPERLDLVADAGVLPIEQLLPFISELDMVVGIDSVCGHMAAMLGVPNLTIWGRNFPTLTNPLGEHSAYISFRPLRCNYSIVPSTASTALITAELVFDRTVRILEGTLQLQQERLSAADILAGIDTLWVEPGELSASVAEQRGKDWDKLGMNVQY